MEQLSIGEVARRANLRPSAIRYYESAGLLPEPRRINGRRRYDVAVLDHLAVIRMAQEAGFTVAEVLELLRAFPEETPVAARWQALARRKLVEVDALIARAQGMRRLLEKALRCGCVRLEEYAELGWSGGTAGCVSPILPAAEPAVTPSAVRSRGRS